MIQIQNLTKKYGDIRAIDGLNFSVKKGEIVGFLGPNGAGKSTTMKIITGYMAPSEGLVTVGGFDVFESPLEVKRRIGYLPETPPLYMDMFVRDYLEYVARLKQVPKERLKTLVDRAIERTNLGEVSKRLIVHLSKGFKQRVGLAQALVSDPEVLILDEPTVGLDPKQVAEVRALIKELAGSHTVVLSTHILPEVQAVCERVIIINRGRIVAEDTLQGLSRRMSGGARVHLRVRKGRDGIVSELQKLSGVIHVETGSDSQTVTLDTDGRDEVCEMIASTVVAKGAGLLELRAHTLSLEDIFLKVTSAEDSESTSMMGGTV